MTFRARALAAALLPAVVLGACSGGGDDEKVPAASAGDAAEETTTTAVPVTVAAPLTGVQVDPGAVNRSAVSIKVDNSPQGRPQAGLDTADVIFEEKVEGGVTRFVAVYHSQDEDLVGPIRSLRTTDPAIVSALGGVFVFSDGVAITLKGLKNAPVAVVSERQGAGPFTYPKGRKRPWATFGSTDDLREAGGEKGKQVPPAFFPFLAEGEAFAPSGALPASKVTVDFGGRTSAMLEWDAVSKKWLRTTNGAPHNLSDGSRLSFTNVIVQKTPYRPVGYHDSAGNWVDEAVVVGSGDAIVLVDGKQAKARWTKSSATAVTTYTDLAGAPIRLSPGNTLVLLPPPANAATVV
ncbi:MAG TPA: DUF3048 domain-containing protein [Acidimicrobiales bacterium]